MRKHIYLAVATATVLIITANCGTPGANTEDRSLEEAKKAIAESNAIYFQAFSKGDSSIFIDRYAEDCCIMAPGVPAVCGKNAAL
jgi:hypothetical protein